MKKILIIILAFSFGSAVFASGDNLYKPANYFDGSYAGIGGGVDHTKANPEAQSTSTLLQVDEPLGTQQQYPTIAGTDISASPEMGAFMVAGEAFVGFGRTFSLGNPNRNNFYLGLELFGKATPTNMGKDETQTVSSIEMNYLPNGSLNNTLDLEIKNYYSLGGDLRFGYLLNSRVMVYVLAGLDIAPYEYTATTYQNYNLYLSNGTSISDSLSLESSTTNWLFGFAPGVGIEAMITDHFSLRAQYVYVFYNNSSFDGGSSASTDPKELAGEFFNLNASLNKDMNGDIQRGLFTIDLTYHFNGI